MSELNLLSVLAGFAGGLALFLYGMTRMTDALKAAAGDRLRQVLAQLTRNRFLAAGTGLAVTAVVQSSSITTVLVVGFLSAGLMSLEQSIGIIMGANIGSTVTAQILAFQVTESAMGLIALGFGLYTLGRKDPVRQAGVLIMSLGLIFLGMSGMSDATRPLRTHTPFLDLLRNLENPLLALLAGTLFTAVIQSSAATTGIVIVFSGQGFLNLETGIAVILGSNIGTCATALLAAWGKPRPAQQAAGVHVLFNVLGVLVWLPFLGSFADMVRYLSPAAADLEGLARLAAETPRQIANAHTLFNVVNTVLFIGFTTWFARAIRHLLPDRPEPQQPLRNPLYLDAVYLQTPSMAVDRIRLELAHLGDIVLEAVQAATRPDASGHIFDDPAVRQRVQDAHALYDEIILYTRRLLSGNVSQDESARITRLLEAANHLRDIADTLEMNYSPLLREARSRQLRPSDDTRRLMNVLHEIVHRSIARTVDAIRHEDPVAAREVLSFKTPLQQASGALIRHLADRLRSDDPDRLPLYRLETQVAELDKRLYYFAKRIARELFPEDAPQDETAGL